MTLRRIKKLRGQYKRTEGKKIPREQDEILNNVSISCRNVVKVAVIVFKLQNHPLTRILKVEYKS